MDTATLARHQQTGLSRIERTLLFLDESASYLLPPVVRTYAPVGETPILHHTLSHDHLSVIGAVGPHEKLCFQVYEAAITSAEVIRFPKRLLRHIPASS